MLLGGVILLGHCKCVKFDTVLYEIENAGSQMA